MVSNVCEVGFALLLQPGVGAGHCYKWYGLSRKSNATAMNVVWRKYKHKQSGDGCRWNVYAECGLFTFARGDCLVRFVSANHVDWHF